MCCLPSSDLESSDCKYPAKESISASQIPSSKSSNTGPWFFPLEAFRTKSSLSSKGAAGYWCFCTVAVREDAPALDPLLWLLFRLESVLLALDVDVRFFFALFDSSASELKEPPAFLFERAERSSLDSSNSS
mmetsp:Transcript_34606/g.74802  ORF Transcript_34606/g.74802 Transcript_34606/m.74802 type:complete len:132 (+) Transcript_34606:563-958(+)